MKPKHPSKALGLLLAGFALAYPLLIYLGHDRIGTRWLGAGALALVGLHCLQAAGKTGLLGGALPEERWVGGLFVRLAPLVALWLAATILGDERLLMLVPALGSVIMGVLFASSLQVGRESWIERVARLSHRVPVLPPLAVRHCRGVTRMWSTFLIANGLVCGALALWGPIAWWTLYAGGIAYGLVGLLMAGEYVYRITRVRPRADLEATELGLQPRHGLVLPKIEGRRER